MKRVIKVMWLKTQIVKGKKNICKKVSQNQYCRFLLRHYFSVLYCRFVRKKRYFILFDLIIVMHHFLREIS